MKRLCLGYSLCSALLLASCGDSAGPDSSAPVSFRVTGDSQVRFPEATLLGNLAVQLIDSSGNDSRTSGLPVSWRVINGGGSLNTVTDNTGIGGDARTKWTLGPDVGAQRVEVTVGTFPPHIFSAEAIVPGPIAFVSNRRTGDTGEASQGTYGIAADVFVMDVDGGNVLQLTPRLSPIEWPADPAWSPDGLQLAYAREAQYMGGNLHVVQSNGEGVRKIGSTSKHYRGPSWSPDGRFFVVWEPSMYELWSQNFSALRVISTERNPLVDSLGTDAWTPDWSRDGSRIVFECGQRFSRGICVTDEDGANETNLTPGPDRDPAWSPGGTQILFAHDSAQAGGIWVMNADGSGQRQVIAGVASSPSWSPDGLEFVATIWDGSQRDIWRVNVATGEAVNLTNGVGWNWEPDWRW